MHARRFSWIIAVVLIALAVWAIWNQIDSQEKATSQSGQCVGEVKPEKGYCAPNFSLKQLDGKTVELYQNDGKPTVINFWATWCPPCKEEMPMLQKAYSLYHDQVRFLMVNETAQENHPDDVKKYIDRYMYTFPVLMDPVTENGTVGDRYQLIGLPITFVVDADGKIIHKIVGGLREETFWGIIEELTKSSS